MELCGEMLEQVWRDAADLAGLRDADDLGRFRRGFLELVAVVDDEGCSLGAAPRGVVHRLGLRHPVVYCLVTQVKGDWLLQVRGEGRLDISVGGHVQAGEDDYKMALCREFKEELGFTPSLDRLHLHTVYNRDAPLKSSKPLERNRERRHVFHYKVDGDELRNLEQAFDHRLSRSAVLTFRWVKPDEASQAVSDGNAADGLASTLEHLAAFRS